MKRLISLITWGSSGGPFPRLIRWLAEGLSYHDRTVDIIFLQDPKGVRQVNDRIREIGFGTRTRLAILPLVQYFKQHRPSLAFVTPAHVALPVLAAGRLARVPVVPWEQTFLSYDRPFLPTGMRHTAPLLRRLLYRWSAAVAATSTDVAEEVKQELKLNQVFVLPNPCSSESIQKAAGSDCKNCRDSCTLVAVGRLIHQKGIDVVLKALHILHKEGLNKFRLAVLGDGPLRRQLEERTKQLGLEEEVNFLGYVPNPYPYMAQSDIFVHASRWEGFGMVIVEAMALGLPVVATSCPGGPKEILGYGEYGRLVPPDDPEALAEVLADLINNPEKRAQLSQASLRRIEFYRPERIAKNLLEIEEFVRSDRADG